MNDFLAKPFTRKSLQEALQRFVIAQRPTAPREILIEAPAVSAAAPPRFDPNAYGQLEAAIGEDGARAVLETFQKDSAQRLKCIMSLAASGNGTGVVRDAHALKSSAASLGFLQLSAVALEVEKTACGAGASELRDMAARLEVSLNDISQTIAELSNRDSARLAAA